MKVKIKVYDLLPAGRLSSLLNFAGAGVHHTSVELTIPFHEGDTSPEPQEYAFGGHDGTETGIFSIPSGTAPSRMPGLRPYMTVDMGEAFGPDWEAAFGRKSSETVAGAPYGSLPSTSQLSLVGDEEEVDDGGMGDGTAYLSVDERRAWRLIERMRAEEQWRGCSYRLLGHNCNSFTAELVFQLTGRRAPGWLNRAAWVATSIPCLVPPGWIDEAEEVAPDAPPPSRSVAPPRTDPMMVGNARG